MYELLCVDSLRVKFAFMLTLQKWLCHVINDLLPRLLGPDKKYEALTFTYGSHKLGQYKKDQASYFLVRTESLGK